MTAVSNELEEFRFKLENLDRAPNEKVFIDQKNYVTLNLDPLIYQKIISILIRYKNNFKQDELVKEVDWILEKMSVKDFSYYNYTNEKIFKMKDKQYEKRETEMKVKAYEDCIIFERDLYLRNKKKFKTVGGKLTEKQTLENTLLEKIKNLKKFSSKDVTASKNSNNKNLHSYETKFDASNQINLLNLSPSFGTKNCKINYEELINFNFNIFDFSEKVGRNKLFLEGSKFILENFKLLDIINNKKLENFLTKVIEGYHNNSYHNFLHGFDVCQTFAVFLKNTNLTQILYLNSYDIISCLISGLIHDIGHPGLNNNFHINALTEYALLYNDKSVLENFHISEAFKILRIPECNIFEITDDNKLENSHKLSNHDFKYIRKRIIDLILATDMTLHFNLQNNVKNAMIQNPLRKAASVENIIPSKKNIKFDFIENNKNEKKLFDDQQLFLNFLFHTADISHSSKQFEISYKWTYYIFEEFWKQGDLEKSMNLQVSFLCDRKSIDVPNSQIDFISNFIIPSYELIIDFLPELEYYKNNALLNIDEWKKFSKDSKHNFKKDK
jgi:hypothetical protein